MADWQFHHLHSFRYDLIMADVPWKFVTWGTKGGSRAPGYDLMSIEDIKALRVGDLAAPDCALLFWVTDPMIPFAGDIIKAWGFEYRTVGFYWAKLNKRAPARFDQSNFFMGQGYYTRANPEQCWLATIGTPQIHAHDVRRLIVSKVRRHSQKPDEAYERAVKVFQPQYPCELFSRTEREGWATWGNQTGTIKVEDDKKG